ncbi:hypothetical protein BX600DRAFT_435245 [Xylariales sp. PMI_506]|nr:hypothetical protein BX600DRAFT_435245 [Xylariales sp. PMI_506]
MASHQPLAAEENAEVARTVLQQFRDPKHSGMQWYTSPRLLRHLVGGKLLGSNNRCETHELWLIPEQSGRSEALGVEYVSCICGGCRERFHITLTAGSTVPFQKTHPQGMHMFALDTRYGRAEMKHSQQGNDHVLERVFLICPIQDCCCRLMIEVLPPRLSDREVDDLLDRSRVRRNFADALSREPQRFAGLPEDYGQDVIPTFLRFINDGLDTGPDEAPRKIKQHNKKFAVSFKDDFDDLLRNLGLTDHAVEDGKAWVFPVLETVGDGVTPFGSKRAKWEDVRAELRIVGSYSPSAVTHLQNAWTDLRRVLCTEYKPMPYGLARSEEDLSLLASLDDYKPAVFVWAAQFFSGHCPRRREEFLAAAERCVGNDEEAILDLTMYRSAFDANTSEQVSAAFEYFSTSANENTDPDYFLGKYYELVQADRTSASRSRALQNLEIVGRYIGVDIVSNIDPAIVESLGATDTTSDGRMNLEQAARFLGPDVEPDWTAEFIEPYVNNLAQDPTVDRAKALTALEVLADFKRERNQEEAQRLETMMEIFKSGGYGGDGFPPMVLTVEPPPDVDTPPGLRNIGNTCYLNSLLQYFYTVKPIRDLVLNFPRNSLSLDEASIQARRIGNDMPIDLEEAIVAKQFIESLQALFISLQETTQHATEPSQKLANTALRSARALLLQKQKKQEAESQPPPLPARPVADPQKTTQDADLIDISVEPINDASDNLSTKSSQTLVNDVAEANSNGSFVEVNVSDGAPDAKVVESGPETSVEAAVVSDIDNDAVTDIFSKDLSLEEKDRIISQRLEESDRKGTDQQDAGEIIEIIFEHIMRAICSEGPMPSNPDLQADVITNTFYSLVVNYTQKADQSMDTAREEVVPDRWINAFPHPKAGESRTLYEALDRTHDIQFLRSSNLARYTAIRTLPPILHICIQRAGATKNHNPVIINEVLYMDRYMEVEKGSELSDARRYVWGLKERLGELEARDEDDPKHSTAPHDDNTQDLDFAVQPAVQTFETLLNVGEESTKKESSEFDSLLRAFAHSPQVGTHKRQLGSEALADTKDQEPPQKKSHAVSHSSAVSSASELGRVLGDATQVFALMTREELQEAKAQIENSFARLQKQKYRLHAVICHSGGTSAGHYWVWIRDFKKDTWVKFNDSTVTVDKRPCQAVIDELNQKGDPYYLAYVRDDMKDDLVDIPQRSMPEANVAPATVAEAMDTDMQIIDGISPDGNGSAPDFFGNDVSVSTKAFGDDDAPPYELL